MAKFVLIHGAWHGAWCFDRLAPLLAAAGHEVIAPDLPGMGEDNTPLERLSMEDWTMAVLHAIARSPGPAILLGHSRGGAVISNAAERRPQAVSRLVYLSAFLLEDGQSVLEAAGLDADTSPAPVQIDAENLSCTLPDDDLTPRFFADCSAEDITFAKARLRPEPLFGLTDKVCLSAERFGTVPKDYVECTLDKAISLAAQRRMQGNWAVQRVRQLPASHSPFFSMPERLAEVLEALAGG